MRIIFEKGEYVAEIMADSIVRVPTEYEPSGYHRLTTMRVVFPRIVLAEFNTHRLFSRNSASSRAIPIAKMIKQVKEHPFIPDRFPKTHKGMQAIEWVYPEDSLYGGMLEAWLEARDLAVQTATKFNDLQISKQLANRILEPYLMHQVIVSSTEWSNFMALRAHEAAQNEIQIIAKLMLMALNSSQPRLLQPGQWHSPFGDRLDQNRIKDLAQALDNATPSEVLARMIAVARCARASYLDFDGKDDYKADINLFDRLMSDGHWSPFEHVAQAMTNDEYLQYAHTYPTRVEYGWCGNFRGFKQLRRLSPREVENRTDERLSLTKLDN